MNSPSIWSEDGSDKNYQWYRTKDNFKDLRAWVDERYYKDGLAQYLDSNFLEQIRNGDFFARIWELKVAEYLSLTGLKMIPTHGAGADFCIALDSGMKVWIEAVLANPSEGLRQFHKNRLEANGGLIDYPKHSMTLRYSSSLYSKGIKIKEKYIDGGLIHNDDVVLIAISGYPPGTGLDPDMEHFLRAIMPMGEPVVHFSNDGTPLDPDTPRSTHSSMPSQTKSNGAEVLKQFLYPGTDFSFIDGVLFAEAKDLQGLMGRVYNIFDNNEFDGLLDVPHIFPNYASENKLPAELTNFFFLHRFVNKPPLISLEEQSPKTAL